MIDPRSGDEGRGVIYVNSVGRRVRGVVSSWNEHFVFCRYSTGDTAAATRREDLNWEHRRKGDAERER